MGTGQPGRPQVQRRVLPDGRVVTIMDDLQPSEEPDDTEDNPPAQPGSAGMLRPPFPVPQRVQQGLAGSDPTYDDPRGSPASPPTKPGPAVPVTVPAPGAVMPGAKQNPAMPPGLPKPPGR